LYQSATARRLGLWIEHFARSPFATSTAAHAAASRFTGGTFPTATTAHAVTASLLARAAPHSINVRPAGVQVDCLSGGRKLHPYWGRGKRRSSEEHGGNKRDQNFAGHAVLPGGGLYRDRLPIGNFAI
jgi:hypothetical protein